MDGRTGAQHGRAATVTERLANGTAIFRFTDDMPCAVAGHAARVGGDRGPAERYWPVRGKVA